MYTKGLGFKTIGHFEDHDGFDGIILGLPHAPYHLEFTTKSGHRAGKAPTEDNLLVFYVPDQKEWETSCEQMKAAGFAQVNSFNPYWDRKGRTFEDLDGYRVVLENGAWDR
jgi:hypothetical protein